MDRTLTIRLEESQDEALTARAAALGKTRSELVRELIARGLEERSSESASAICEVASRWLFQKPDGGARSRNGIGAEGRG